MNERTRLSLPPRTDANRPRRDALSAPQSRPNRRPAPSKPKQEKTGHEAFLSDCQADRRPIAVTLSSKKLAAGLIVEFDKYAVVIEESTGVKRVIFKHAIEEMSALSDHMAERFRLAAEQGAPFNV